MRSKKLLGYFMIWYGLLIASFVAAVTQSLLTDLTKWPSLGYVFVGLLVLGLVVFIISVIVSGIRILLEE